MLRWLSRKCFGQNISQSEFTILLWLKKGIPISASVPKKEYRLALVPKKEYRLALVPKKEYRLALVLKKEYRLAL
ncbi:21518_t:CDS:1, partial [Racocetra persica]